VRALKYLQCEINTPENVKEYSSVFHYSYFREAEGAWCVRGALLVGTPGYFGKGGARTHQDVGKQPARAPHRPTDLPDPAYKRDHGSQSNSVEETSESETTGLGLFVMLVAIASMVLHVPAATQDQLCAILGRGGLCTKCKEG
jgi:hypothetical protein